MSIIGDVETLAVPGVGPAAFALKHWKLILGGIGFAVLGTMLLFAKADARHWHKQADQCSAARTADQKAWKDAYAKAVADDAAHSAAVKAADDQITQEKTHALETQLVDARTAVARYASLHAAPKANPSGGGSPAMPTSTDPSSTVDGAGENAIVSVADLNICSENTVKVAGWQSWWKDVSNVER